MCLHPMKTTIVMTSEPIPLKNGSITRQSEDSNVAICEVIQVFVLLDRENVVYTQQTKW